MSTQTIRPVSTILQTSFTVVGASTAHEAVDEETQNGDTDYATCNSATAVLALGLQNHVIPEDAVFNSLTVACWLRRLAGAVGTVHLDIGVRSGETFYMIAELDILGSSYVAFSGTSTASPVTGLPWTAAAINASDWCFVATLGPPRATIRITQADGEVDYEIPTFTQWVDGAS